mgnify:CR=1 FL=1
MVEKNNGSAGIPEQDGTNGDLIDPSDRSLQEKSKSYGPHSDSTQVDHLEAQAARRLIGLAKPLDVESTKRTKPPKPDATNANFDKRASI